MNPYLGEGEWVFNSLFESGNLDCAIKVGECEFDLFLRVDANTKGHVQWFYFSVKNGSRKQNLKMNLCNLSKAKSLYEAVIWSLLRVCSRTCSRGRRAGRAGRGGARREPTWA